jgi:hypothetical protein
VPRSRRTALLRGGGFLLAAGLGVVGVWLIVTGNDSKHVRIGAICAFWGLLLGTYAMFGARLPARAPDARPVAPQAPPTPPPSRELDLRQIGEIERSAVAAARREFQQELQLMLRREVQDGFAQEVASLRAEVNALRSDLVEKVGGQLRLERIETTRLIGSDLEAVQSELRKLRETAVEPEPPRVQLAAPQEIHEAEIVVDRIDTVTKPVEPAVERDVEPVREPVTTVKAALPQQVTVPPPVVQPPPVRREPEPDQPRPDGADPFAGMPRITPFTDFALDSAPPPADRATSSRNSRHRAEEGGHDVLARILSREQR